MENRRNEEIAPATTDALKWLQMGSLRFTQHNDLIILNREIFEHVGGQVSQNDSKIPNVQSSDAVVLYNA